MKYRIKAAICLVGIMLCAGCSGKEEPAHQLTPIESIESENVVPTFTEEVEATDAVETAKIGVYICGAVQIPGVYYFPEGTRICEGIQAAGQMTDDAAAEYLNQAEVMYDGQKVYVPTVTEVKEGNVPAETSASDSSAMEQSTALVNINTASIDELKTLPGVGDAKAKSIVAYRENVGSFQKEEDIMLVEGIKEGMYAKLKDSIRVK